MIKHTLFHQLRGKTQTQLQLTVAQAAYLLKKNLMQKTGSMPGQINYHSTAKLANVKKAMGEVKEPEAEPKQSPEVAPADPVATVATAATTTKAKPKAKGKTPTKKSGKTAPAAVPEPVEPVVAAAVIAEPATPAPAPAPALPEPATEAKELVAQPA